MKNGQKSSLYGEVSPYSEEIPYSERFSQIHYREYPLYNNYGAYSSLLTHTKQLILVIFCLNCRNWSKLSDTQGQTDGQKVVEIPTLKSLLDKYTRLVFGDLYSSYSDFLSSFFELFTLFLAIETLLV